MKSIINELWHGNIIPQEDSRTNSKEMKELLSYMARHHEDLEKSFTDEQKEVFEKFHDCWNEYMSLAEAAIFEYAAIKDDIRRARMYSEQAKFLGKYGLEMKDDLIQHALKVDPQIKALCKERRALWNKIRWMKDPEQVQPIRDEIFALSKKIKTLRKEFAMCKDVYDRSASVERTVMLIEFPQLLEQEKQKSALKKDVRENR